MEKVDNGIVSKGYLALVCFVASLGGLLFGFDTAVISVNQERHNQPLEARGNIIYKCDYNTLRALKYQLKKLRSKLL